MYSLKLKTCGRAPCPISTVRSFLLLLAGLFAGQTVEAQTYDWKPVKIHGGGFVSGILFHPEEPGLMYCRTDIGGSYRWNPTDDTWISLLDFIGFPNNEWSLVGTESIGLDAQDPNRLYLSCGWLGNPSEIMISTNRGATFTRINSPFVIRANNDGRGSGERFGVDPNLGSTIFYGTREDGLWKSVNSAANWAKVNSFPVNTTPNGVGISFIEFIRSSGTPGSATPVIWLGVSQTGTNLFRSTDAGLTWTGIATNGVPANCLPLRAAQDGLGNMYITFCDAPGPGGISTGVVRKFNLATLDSHSVTPPVGQGGYGGVSVDRQNPNRIVVTTANRWWPMSDIYRSTNGGTNWTAVYNGTVDTSSAPWVGAGGNVVQGWMFDVKIDPYNSNRVYYVTGGGIFSSYNFTAATPTWEFRSTGLEETAFTSIGANLASPPSGPQVWSVLGDMGGFSHYDLDASPALTNYYNPHRANNYGIDFAEQSPHVVVRTFSDFSGERGGYISTNYGSTWSPFPATPPPAQTDSGPGYVAISADGTRLVWTIAGSAPYYSTDGGVTWTPCAGSNLTPTESWVQPFCFSDRVNPNKFYLYYRNTGGVFVSTDGGASFALTNTISAWGDSMRPAYGQESSLWVAVYDGLWRTTNSGASFFKVPGVQAARSVGFGRTATGTGHPVVYLHGQIGGVWGIYRSENQGTNWTRINDDQHQYGNIQQVIGDPKIYGRCYIAAGGRGILYGDIPNQPPFPPVNLVAAPAGGAVQLSWGPVVGAASYIIKRSITSGSGSTNIASGVTATNYLDSDVVIGTTYYYVVAATNVYGVSPDSTEVSGTPGPAATITVNTVGTLNGNGKTFLEATGNSLNEATLAANIATAFANNAGGVWNFDGTAFNVTSGQTIALTYGTSQANSLILTLTEGAGGNGINQAAVGTGEAISGATVLGLGGTGATRTFTPDKPLLTVAIFNTDRNDATRIPVLTVTFQDNTTASTSVANADNVYFHGLSGTESNPIVSFAISQNNFIRYDDLAFIVAKPPAPQNVTATMGDANVALAWSAAANATAYYVKRSTTSGSGYTTVATTTSLTFTNTGLTNGTLYYYVVSALNGAGESTNSPQVSARPTSSAPVAMNAANAAGRLQISWPADHTGWILQAQTNSLAIGLGTNWVNLPASMQTNQMTVPLNATNDAVFFRLVRPY